MSSPTPDPSAVIGRLLTFSLKLSEALTDAEPFGGLIGLRKKMKPSMAARVVAELKMLRDELSEQLEDLERAEFRKARRVPGHEANRPDPDREAKKGPTP